MARAGLAARFPFLISSHVLRHSCGYKLANDGHDTRAIQHYLGHRSIASTVRYTAMAPDRFKRFLEGLERRAHQWTPLSQREASWRRGSGSLGQKRGRARGPARVSLPLQPGRDKQ